VSLNEARRHFSGVTPLLSSGAKDRSGLALFTYATVCNDDNYNVLVAALGCSSNMDEVPVALTSGLRSFRGSPYSSANARQHADLEKGEDHGESEHEHEAKTSLGSIELVRPLCSKKLNA